MTTGHETWTLELEDALRAELTVEAFAAGLLGDSHGLQTQPYWLCTREEAKHEMLARFKGLYDRWVELETLLARTRFDMRSDATLRSVLTHEAFTVGFLGDANGPRFEPLWLNITDEARTEALTRIQVLYEEWVELELEAARARFEIEQEALRGSADFMATCLPR
jgi:hypothetical protein